MSGEEYDDGGYAAAMQAQYECEEEGRAAAAAAAASAEAEANAEYEAKEAEYHNCLRCGLCCKVHYDHWLKAELTADEKTMLRFEVRSRYPKGDSEHCEMLVQENGLAVCLIHRELGKSRKPALCRDYPPAGQACKGKRNKK